MVNNRLRHFLASQLHLTGKKVLVVDPTGEWSKLMASTDRDTSEECETGSLGQK